MGLFDALVSSIAEQNPQVRAGRERARDADLFAGIQDAVDKDPGLLEDPQRLARTVLDVAKLHGATPQEGLTLAATYFKLANQNRRLSAERRFGDIVSRGPATPGRITEALAASRYQPSTLAGLAGVRTKARPKAFSVPGGLAILGPEGDVEFKKFGLTPAQEAKLRQVREAMRLDPDWIKVERGEMSKEDILAKYSRLVDQIIHEGGISPQPEFIWDPDKGKYVRPK